MPNHCQHSTNNLPTLCQNYKHNLPTLCCTALRCHALPCQGYGPKLMFLLLSTALKDKGKKNGHTEYMANFFWANLELKVVFNS